MESEHITLLASMCDNTRRVLLTREIHPSFSVQSFKLEMHYRAKIKWLTTQVVELSLQVNQYHWDPEPTLNDMVGLSGIAVPILRSFI